jgi:formylmethanofuran--tetrahydromethanopterin N-formyltransferase
VLDGLDFRSIATAMRAGIDAACRAGVHSITAGNYGGKLGPYHFHLHRIMSGDLEDAPKAAASSPATPA